MVLIYICISVSVYWSMYVLYLFICACDFKSEHYQKSYHPCLTFGKFDTLLHQTHSKNCWYYGAMTRQLYVHNIIKQNNILHVAWSPIESKQKSNKKRRRGGGGRRRRGVLGGDEISKRGGKKYRRGNPLFTYPSTFQFRKTMINNYSV